MEVVLYSWLICLSPLFTVPPRIVLEESSVDVEATEGTTVRLQCNATGTPPPIITWSARRSSEPRNSSKAGLYKFLNRS